MKPMRSNQYGYKKKSVITKHIGSVISKIAEKGQEHLTVMFIPHSEKKIFNFQISHFSLVIFILTIITIAVIGSLSYYKSVQLDIKKDLVTDTNIRLNQDVREFIDTTPKIKEEVVRVNKAVDKLLITSSLKNPYDNLPKGAGGPNVTPNEIMNPELLLQDADKKRVGEINELKDLAPKLRQAEQEINSVTKVLKGHKGVFKNLPSIFPVRGGGYVVSGFGWRRDPFNYRMTIHSGVDIVNIPNTPIIAAADGIVTEAQDGGGKGLYVELRHKYEFTTQYLHMSAILVNVGQKVKKGQIIGKLGNTGRSTGPHLHYEVRINNKPIDPQPFITLDKFGHFNN